MAKDIFCGCLHVTTGAAVMGVLQSVMVVLLLSTSGVLLERSQVWRSNYEEYFRDAAAIGQAATSTLSSWQSENETSTFWRELGLVSFLEIHLTHHVAFYCLWLVFLVMYALAFKSYRPALVLPNLIMQVIAVALIMVLAGVTAAKLVVLSFEYARLQNSDWERDEIETRYTFYSILLGCLVIAWFAELVFIWIGIDFYRLLRDMQHTVYPSSSPRRATSHHRNQQEAHQLPASIEAMPKCPQREAMM